MEGAGGRRLCTGLTVRIGGIGGRGGWGGRKCDEVPALSAVRVGVVGLPDTEKPHQGDQKDVQAPPCHRDFIERPWSTGCGSRLRKMFLILNAPQCLGTTEVCPDVNGLSMARHSIAQKGSTTGEGQCGEHATGPFRCRNNHDRLLNAGFVIPHKVRSAHAYPSIPIAGTARLMGWAGIGLVPFDRIALRLPSGNPLLQHPEVLIPAVVQDLVGRPGQRRRAGSVQDQWDIFREKWIGDPDL